MIEKKPGKKIFASVGNKISLKTTSLVRSLIKKEEWLPEPLRLADLYSKKLIEKTQIEKNLRVI